MSNIPVIQSVVNQMLTEYIVEGVILNNGAVSYKGGIVPAIFMNGTYAIPTARVLMTKVNNQWYVIAVENVVHKPRTFILANDFVSISGSGFTTFFLSTAWFGIHNYQSTPAIGNSASTICLLAKGTYVFKLFCGKGTDRGIVEWYVNDVLIGTEDTYSNTVTRVIASYVFNVPQTGSYNIRYVVTGKNGASSNFYFAFSAISIVPA